MNAASYSAVQIRAQHVLRIMGIARAIMRQSASSVYVAHAECVRIKNAHGKGKTPAMWLTEAQYTTLCNASWTTIFTYALGLKTDVRVARTTFKTKASTTSCFSKLYTIYIEFVTECTSTAKPKPGSAVIKEAIGCTIVPHVR